MRFFRSALVSYLVVILGIIGGYLVSHGDLNQLIVLGMMWIVFLAPLGITALAFGWRPTFQALRSLRVLWTDHDEAFVREENRQVLLYWVERVYSMGLLAVIFGVIITMGAISGSKAELGLKIAHSLVGLVWAVIIGEVLLRPAATRIGMRLKNPDPSASGAATTFPAVVWGAFMLVMTSAFFVLWLIAG